MENELIIREQSALELVTEKSIGDIIKPLSHEVFLLDTYIAGTKCLDAEDVKGLKPGDKLMLRRKESEFDKFAIIVRDESGQMLGYIPEKDDVVLARLMDAGKCLSARITDVEAGEDFPYVEIGVSLTDY